MVLYLDTTAISNQIKDHLTTNRRNFLEMLYGFYRYALLADLLWLVVERAFTKNSRKAGMWLFGASLWKIIKALWLVKYSSLFLLTGEPGIVNFQGCGMYRARCHQIDREPCVISNTFKSLQKFQGRSAFWFTYIDELKIKYLLKLYFSQTLIFAGFFDFIH